MGHRTPAAPRPARPHRLGQPHHGRERAKPHRTSTPSGHDGHDTSPPANRDSTRSGSTSTVTISAFRTTHGAADGLGQEISGGAVHPSVPRHTDGADHQDQTHADADHHIGKINDDNTPWSSSPETVNTRVMLSRRFNRYYDRLRLPSSRPTHFPGSLVIERHRYRSPCPRCRHHEHLADDRAGEGLSSSRRHYRYVPRPVRRRVPRHLRFQVFGAFHRPSP